MLTVVIIFQNDIPYLVRDSEFLIAYWYLVVVVPCLIIWLGFFVNIFINKKNSGRGKFWWGLSLFFFMFYAMPVYWWFCMRNAPNKRLKDDSANSVAS